MDAEGTSPAAATHSPESARDELVRMMRFAPSGGTHAGHAAAAAGGSAASSRATATALSPTSHVGPADVDVTPAVPAGLAGHPRERTRPMARIPLVT